MGTRNRDMKVYVCIVDNKVKDEVYTSKKDACNSLGVSHHSAWNWKKNAWLLRSKHEVVVIEIREATVIRQRRGRAKGWREREDKKVNGMDL